MGRRRKEPADWHSKVTSELVELLTAYRESVRAVQMAGEKGEEHVMQIGKDWQEYLRRKLPTTVQTYISRPTPEELIYPLYIKALDTMTSDSALGIGMTEKFHWLRFREPYAATLREYEKGSLKAAKKLLRTWWDFEQWRLAGKCPPAFKVDYDHDCIFTSAWGLGLENLNEEELAMCSTSSARAGEGNTTVMLCEYSATAYLAL